MKHYKVNRLQSKKIIQAMDAFSDNIKTAKKLMKPYKIKDIAYYGVRGIYYVDVFVLGKNSDAKLFVKMKDDFYKLRKIKQNLDTIAKLEELRSPIGSVAADQVGYSIVRPTGCHSPGVVIRSDYAYISVPDDAEPINCIRISDIKYEEIVKAVEESG